MAQALLSLSRLVAPREPLDGGEIAEAREALEYWSARAAALPWHRRAARREARVLAARWRARLVRAHLERWHLGGALGRFVAPLADTGSRSVRAHYGRLAWRSVRRTVVVRVAVVLSLLTVATAVCMVVALAVVAHLVGV